MLIFRMILERVHTSSNLKLFFTGLLKLSSHGDGQNILFTHAKKEKQQIEEAGYEELHK